MAVTGAAVLVLVASGALAPAEAGPGRGRNRGEVARRVAHELDLTAEQRERIRDIVRSHWEAGLGDLARQARDARRQLRRLIHDPEAPESEIRAAVRGASVPAENLAVARHRLARDVQEVLTPEQRRRAQEIGLHLGALGDRAFRRFDGDVRGLDDPRD